jgi:hypothetical protein
VACVAACAEPIVPRTLGMLAHHFQHRDVATDTIVLVVAPQWCPSRSMRLVPRFVAGCPPPCPRCLHKPTQAFPDGLALDDPLALACCAPIGGKSEQVTCPRAPCRLIAAGWLLAGKHHRFLRVHGEAETGDAVRPHRHHPAGIGFQRAAQADIIGKTRQTTAARPPGLDGFDTPCGQAMRQAYMGAHGRNDAALGRPCVGGPQRSRLQHASVEPCANPSEYSPLLDPLRENRPQRAPVQILEKAPDIRID